MRISKRTGELIKETVNKVRNDPTHIGFEDEDFVPQILLLKGKIDGELARGTLEEPSSCNFSSWYWNPDSEVLEDGATDSITIYDTGVISEADDPLEPDRQVTIAFISGQWFLVDYADRSGGASVYYGKLQSALTAGGSCQMLLYDPETGTPTDEEIEVWELIGQGLPADMLVTARGVTGSDRIYVDFVRPKLVARNLSIVPVSSVSQLIECVVLTYDPDTQQAATTSEHVFILWLGPNTIEVAANSQLYAYWDKLIGKWVLDGIKCN